MCDFELNFTSIEERFDIDFMKYFKWGLNNLKEMEEDDLVVVTRDSIKVNQMLRRHRPPVC